MRRSGSDRSLGAADAMELAAVLHPDFHSLVLPPATLPTDAEKARFPHLKMRGWDSCSSPSLRGHIVGTHFLPWNLAHHGVARYDIEVARHRDIPLDWVAKRAIVLMSRSHADIERDIAEDGVSPGFDPCSYRTVLLKNLIYMDTLGLAKIDWRHKALNDLPPRAFKLNLASDSTDNPFDPNGQNAYGALIRKKKNEV